MLGADAERVPSLKGVYPCNSLLFNSLHNGAGHGEDSTALAIHCCLIRWLGAIRTVQVSYLAIHCCVLHTSLRGHLLGHGCDLAIHCCVLPRGGWDVLKAERRGKSLQFIVVFCLRQLLAQVARDAACNSLLCSAGMLLLWSCMLRSSSRV